jgi:hypothetical protein
MQVEAHQHCSDACCDGKLHSRLKLHRQAVLQRRVCDIISHCPRYNRSCTHVVGAIFSLRKVGRKIKVLKAVCSKVQSRAATLIGSCHVGDVMRLKWERASMSHHVNAYLHRAISPSSNHKSNLRMLQRCSWMLEDIAEHDWNRPPCSCASCLSKSMCTCIYLLVLEYPNHAVVVSCRP